MTFHYCDRCGRRLFPDRPSYLVINQRQRYDPDRRTHVVPDTPTPDDDLRFVLCFDCTDELESVLTSFPTYVKKQVAKEPVDF